jgi:hypothetical protein
MVPDSVQGTRVEDEPRLGGGGRGEEPRNLTRLDSLSLAASIDQEKKEAGPSLQLPL